MNTQTTVTMSSPESDTTRSKTLNILPDFKLPTEGCSTHTQQQIDLLLLAIEALEVGAAEKMLQTAAKLELQDILKNRVTMWRLRRTNPWRRSYNRKSLSLEQAKALTLVASDRARALSPLIRELLLAEQQMRDRRLPVEVSFRLSDYLERFQSHFRSRMNRRRTKVALYLASEKQLNQLALSLLNRLFLCSGTKGLERLWISLFDGEVR